MQHNIKTLIWKSYLQRQRRWPILLMETLFAGIFFVLSVFIAKPVFLLPIRDEPEPPLTADAILSSLHNRTILGFAPNTHPFDQIMSRASNILNINILKSNSEDELNNELYKRSRDAPLNNSVIWIIWNQSENNVWKFSIKSTERARMVIGADTRISPGNHLSTGFLGVQMAVSQAILEHVAKTPPKFDLCLVSMPVSPLMVQPAVKKALAWILLCFTIALLPPVLEIEALVVTESMSRFKRALCIRNVTFPTIYFGWTTYAYFTAMPICLLASITLILIFRWIHLLFALITILAYKTVLLMLAFIMAMFHSKAWIACTWTILFTLMQTFISELLVQQHFDIENMALTFILQVILPPLGLVHAFNEFALLQTGREFDNMRSLLYPILSWLLMIAIYFVILMILQRTVSSEKAIGGQVSWKSIIFKKSVDRNRLHRIESLTGNERQNLQPVDEFVAKAVSFQNVSKSIMENVVLNNVTFDIYRGEFTIIMADRINHKTITALEDLMTGLTFADNGSINVLGQELIPGSTILNTPHLAGFCHRSEFLIQELTVGEHLLFFLEICLGKDSSENITEYSQVRLQRLLHECDLEVVKNKQVKNLADYYQAQLCWAIALLLEPRVIILDSYIHSPMYDAVIRDKIMRYKKYVTIIKFSFTSVKMEYADRVFLFDSKILIFGGTPAYMFFKYGREYRVRLTFSCGFLENDAVPVILQKARTAGATVRASLGSLLILRVPAFPTATVAALIKDFTENSKEYGITSMHISVPDSEEVCQRAANELKSRMPFYEQNVPANLTKNALIQMSEFPLWKRKQSGRCESRQFRAFGRKYYTFYAYYKIYFLIMITSAALAGVTIGIIKSDLLIHLQKDESKTLHAELLTVESTKQNTTMVLQLDNSSTAISIAKSYVLSETGSTAKEIENIDYTALATTESLTEYLVTRAIDSPQLYVTLFAYGIEIYYHENDGLKIRVLHSPLHYDSWTAPRSLARAYMALIRHYTGIVDASIQVTDEPLGLDFTRWLMYAGQPPILVQFLLTLTVLHMTHIPSKEHGLVRHMQCHAMNFSPINYWLAMFVCDFTLYTFLACLMTAMITVIMYLVTPTIYYRFEDLGIISLLIIIYGMGCIPQAYLFSLGPQAALNSMIFMIVNILLGETAIIAIILYGEQLNYALHFICLSPQFNVAYAFAKIKKTFLNNIECVIYDKKNLCSAKTLHKCCEMCGILQQCFKPKSYIFDVETGILKELVAIVTTSCIFMSLLLLWEYRMIQHMWIRVLKKIISVEYVSEPESSGVRREREEAIEKHKVLLESAKSNMVNNFGGYLLAVDVANKYTGDYTVRNLYLGLEKGEVKALSGVVVHGRRDICEILAGYKIPINGTLWAMSTWEARRHPHKYARNIALCSIRNPLPSWMTVFEALKMIAILRGVPKKRVKQEVANYIDSLEFREKANFLIHDLQAFDRPKLHFAAALIGAPPILILDEFTAHQKYSVRRAMYYILGQLRKRGHAIITSSCSVEAHMPVTSRLAILLHGIIYDIDNVDVLVDRYSQNGFTVVLHLKDDLDVKRMLRRYFTLFVINDMSEVLVNVQILDLELNWMAIFEKLEMLVAENKNIYSYIVTAIPVDYVYNSILAHERRVAVKERETFSFVRKFFMSPLKIKPTPEAVNKLIPFQQKYNITKLTELPWSVIFQR